jgi:hypothetical protein
MKLRSCLLLPLAIAVTTAPIVSISFPNLQPAFSATPKQEKKDKTPTPASPPKPCVETPQHRNPFRIKSCPESPKPESPKPKPPKDVPGAAPRD